MQRTLDHEVIIGEVMEPSLSEVAHLGLTVGRMLLEWGANARTVHEGVSAIARGLGCDSAEVFCQHAAIILMLRRRDDICTQMGKVGEHVVNLRRTQNLQEIIQRVNRGELTCAEAQSAVERVPEVTAKYQVWFVCLATGLACSAFGRLFRSDWVSFLPTLLGAGVGQYVRHTLFHRKYNIFLTAGTVSFISATLAGFGARALGSTHLPLAMVAAVLLLVPGIPVLNAQIDVIEGKPNLAAARALRITYLLLFMALVLSLAQGLILSDASLITFPATPEMPLWLRILHQAFFGGLAAAGFGVLFNTPPRILGLCFASGAFALAVRTICQGYDLGLPIASFIAALFLATVDRAWHSSQSLLGSVLAVVGCIAMVPGSLAAKAFIGLFALVHAPAENAIIPLVATMETLIIVTFTLVAIGIGLIIPTLIYPERKEV